MPHKSQSDSELDVEGQTRLVLVEGDVTLDCHIGTYRKPDDSSLWREQGERVPFVTRAGGAALLGDLIERLALSLSQKWKVVFNRLPDRSEELSRLYSVDLPRLYSVWYRYASDVAEGGWRVSKFLGSDSPSTLPPPEPVIAPSTPDLIVIDDKGHQFRQDANWWSKAIEQAHEHTWFLIRTGRPLKDNEMWEQLRNQSANVIVVITADDLRQSEVFVSRLLSWELTAQDLYDEFLQKKNSALSQFRTCEFVVVCFTASAVVVIQNPQSRIAGSQELASPHCWLVYDPASLEDEQWQDSANGRIYGYTYCVIAAVVKCLLQGLPNPPQAEQMNNAIKNGLSAARNLYEKGFETADDGGINFPINRVIEEVTGDSKGSWGVVEVPARTSENSWTLFQMQAGGSLDQLAKRIVIEGFGDLLRTLPFYKVNEDLFIADRREIESFRSVQRLLRRYRKSDVAKPLSIAVFGPPGCGKSFGIEQLAKSEIAGIGFAPLTFNLSQLSSPDDLRGAFHQIRDKSLSGELPLVFWDEFDCKLHDQKLGWLRFFLSPMQDGRFREAQTEHFIGRAIFVFAGGTAHSVEEFCRDMNSEQEERKAEARLSKTPDFVSRLQGYLNVLGLDPIPSAEEDPLYVIRRAIVLHSQLKKNKLLTNIGANGKPQMNIDPGVLNAMLHVKKYKHGVRSMEAIILMSLLSSGNRFERSSLPLEAQLDLHVDAKDFLSRLMTDA